MFRCIETPPAVAIVAHGSSLQKTARQLQRRSLSQKWHASRLCCWPLSRGPGSRESVVRRVVRSLVSALVRRYNPGGPLSAVAPPFCAALLLAYCACSAGLFISFARRSAVALPGILPVVLGLSVRGLGADHSFG